MQSIKLMKHDVFRRNMFRSPVAVQCNSKIHIKRLIERVVCVNRINRLSVIEIAAK